MSNVCPECARSFTGAFSLKKHLEQQPSHSKITVSEVFKDYGIPRSPITDALCDADLVQLPAMDSKRLEMFGDFVPR